MKKLGLLIFSFLTILGCQRETSDHLMIAVAANMQFATEKLTEAFTSQTGIECDLVISSSGKLTAQIKEGAPFDVFVSANMKYPKDLHNTGFSTKKPEVYALGRLVMWSANKDITPTFELLPKQEIKHIALANPKNAPYGQAATDVLNNLNIYRTIEEKLVFGESIAQTNQFITSGSADIGFTAKSVVLSSKTKNFGNWTEISDKFYTPISQGAVVIKRKDGNIKKAEQFYDFLFSDESKNILKEFGYSVPENNP